MTIEEIKQQHEEKWLSMPGVVSVGIGLGRGKEKVIYVGVSTSIAFKDSIPAHIEGYKVVVRKTGMIRAQNDQESKSDPQ
jgi:hypothetical protein